MEHDMGELSHSSNWQSVADTPSSEPISALFMLKHQAHKLQELEETFWAVSDPQNSRYGEHLTRDQTSELLTPAAGNIERVTAFLKENGVSSAEITFPNADMVEVQTTASVAEKLFNAKFHTFVHEKTNTVLHRVASYTLPAEVAEVVEIVGGIVRLPEIQTPIIVPDSDVGASWPEPCGSKCANKVAPEVLMQAYNYTPVKSPAPGMIYDMQVLQTFSAVICYDRQHSRHCRIPGPEIQPKGHDEIRRSMHSRFPECDRCQ
jgi:subtilase family serine protease